MWHYWRLHSIFNPKLYNYIVKHFIIEGPKTKREFDIEDDQMLVWQIFNAKDYATFSEEAIEVKAQNEVITKKQ